MMMMCFSDSSLSMVSRFIKDAAGLTLVDSMSLTI